jgi:hypothetical protein
VLHRAVLHEEMLKGVVIYMALVHLNDEVVLLAK